MIHLTTATNKPVMTFTIDEMINHIKERAEKEPAMFTEYIESMAGMLWIDGHKVYAIRLLRTFFPVRFKEIKEHCESMWG